MSFDKCSVSNISRLMTVEDHRRKADVLLRKAAQAENMRERGKLIDEAMYWHNLAVDGSRQPPSSSDADGLETERRAKTPRQA